MSRNVRCHFIVNKTRRSPRHEKSLRHMRTSAHADVRDRRCTDVTLNKRMDTFSPIVREAYHRPIGEKVMSSSAHGPLIWLTQYTSTVSVQDDRYFGLHVLVAGSHCSVGLQSDGPCGAGACAKAGAADALTIPAVISAARNFRMRDSPVVGRWQKRPGLLPLRSFRSGRARLLQSASCSSAEAVPNKRPPMSTGSVSDARAPASSTAKKY